MNGTNHRAVDTMVNALECQGLMAEIAAAAHDKVHPHDINATPFLDSDGPVVFRTPDPSEPQLPEDFDPSALIS